MLSESEDELLEVEEMLSKLEDELLEVGKGLLEGTEVLLEVEEVLLGTRAELLVECALLEVTEVLVVRIVLLEVGDTLGVEETGGSVDELEATDDEELEVPVVVASLYISILFPAPQYSYWSPGQMKLQSPWLGASSALGSMEFPQ